MSLLALHWQVHEDIHWKLENSNMEKMASESTETKEERSREMQKKLKMESHRSVSGYTTYNMQKAKTPKKTETNT